MRFVMLVLVLLIFAGGLAYTLDRPSEGPATAAVTAPRSYVARTAPKPVPDDLKQPTMLYFRKLFVLPDTTIWHFDYAKPYPLGGITVCGRVNFQNSDRVYSGDKLFYTVFQDGKVIDGGVLGNVVDDPVGTTAASRHSFCEQA